ncbi:uncharacterized protein LOC125951931 [Anopheles darlingi]|uniref:uncharacterized protein LOC125951931 n=1 Tax=Anopheles darlingi TaxID=43151 RepID=UPI0021000D10|nr:uncharacterized protein LOC125951931 [Anopheles darlingi]
MRFPVNQRPARLLPLLLLLTTSGWSAPLATGDTGGGSVVTIGRCAANGERLLHVENLTIVKSPTTTLTGTLEIHIDPRFAVSCVRALPKTPSSRAALRGYRFPHPSRIEIHVQEQPLSARDQQPSPMDESSLDYQLLVYGVRRRIQSGPADA